MIYYTNLLFLVGTVGAIDTHPDTLDVVITWLNASDPVWRAADGNDKDMAEVNPVAMANVDLSDTFVELKYVIKGLKTHMQKQLGTIYVVHSELHNPPAYLNQSADLVFVNHSQLLERKYRPTFNRNAITSVLHRIEKLRPWYLMLDDDMFLTAPFDWLDFFRDGKAVTHNYAKKPKGKVSLGARPADGFYGAIWTSKQLLGEHFGFSRVREGGSHVPVIAYRPAWVDIERLWPNILHKTRQSRLQQADNVYPPSLIAEYMIDIGLAVPSGKVPLQIAELHTHGVCCSKCDGIIEKGTAACAEAVRNWLKRHTGNYRWIQIQGPGFDDAYRFRRVRTQDSPVLRRVAREWYSQAF
eukprot:UC4_evm2s157